MAESQEAQKQFAMGMSLYKQGWREEAAARFRLAVAADPESARAHAWLAWCISDRDNTAEAIEHLRLATQLAPDSVTLLQSLGALLKRTGEFQEAETQLRKAMELEPDNLEAIHEFLSCKQIGDEDRPLLARLEAGRGDPSVADSLRQSICFTLGRAYETLGDYEEAMRAFDEANALGKQIRWSSTAAFDPETEARFTSYLIDTFTNSPLTLLRQCGSDSELPVFVVGMIRSGTTLLDQILSSHTDLASAGELTFWRDRLTPNLLQSLYADRGGAEKLAELTSRYLGLVKGIGLGAVRVTDKNPMNYHFLGLLHLAFPNARIIHIRRNPIDTCLSIYTTEFGDPPPIFAFDKRNIATAYRQYHRLMELWRGFIPGDRLIEVDYEDLVSDREPVIRSVLEFIGLPWDKRCLHHEGNRTPVATPSVWQVRQGVYSSSVDRWRRFEPWLGELGEVGGSVGR